MTSLQRSASQWEHNAKSNAFWAILTDVRKSSCAWEREEFFATGRDEVRMVLDRVRALGAFPDPAGRVLDFGCGVGRTTRALMEYFAQGYGIDISRTMIERARDYSAADARRAQYLVNTRDNLAAIESESIDFVYSHIVLQHVPAQCQAGFIAEFLRVLKPGGVAAFQIPTACLEGDFRRRLRAVKRLLRRVIPGPMLRCLKWLLGQDASTASVSMEMNVSRPETVLWIVLRNGGMLLDAPFTNSTDKNHRGRIKFMSEERARSEILNGITDSPYLSQFFFVRKCASGSEQGG